MANPKWAEVHKRLHAHGITVEVVSERERGLDRCALKLDQARDELRDMIAQRARAREAEILEEAAIEAPSTEEIKTKEFDIEALESVLVKMGESLERDRIKEGLAKGEFDAACREALLAEEATLIVALQKALAEVGAIAAKAIAARAVANEHGGPERHSILGAGFGEGGRYGTAGRLVRTLANASWKFAREIRPPWLGQQILTSASQIPGVAERASEIRAQIANPDLVG